MDHPLALTPPSPDRVEPASARPIASSSPSPPGAPTPGPAGVLSVSDGLDAALQRAEDVGRDQHFALRLRARR